MDRSVQHAFDAEEVMAYLDGELDPQRAAELAAHLLGCSECQEVAQGFRAVSERMLSFEVPPMNARMTDVLLRAHDSHDPLTKATNERPAKTAIRNWRWFFPARYAWGFAGIVLVLMMLVIGVSTRQGLSVKREARGTNEVVGSRDVGPLALSETQSAEVGTSPEASPAPPPPPPDELQAPESVGPMIAETASLTIVAPNFDEASAAIERLAAARGGYVEKLDAKAQTGSARELSATLRIPAKQLDGFLADLRKLGHVEEESRGNEEVSAQYVDLQARLKAARATEQRLIELLGTRTGKLSDVLEAERELARVRGEIESMQGENAVLVHRVSYASVQVELSEVYRERLTTDSKGTKIRNALVEGLTNVEDGAVSLSLFLLAFGPAIVFWLSIFLVPAWLVWRRFRRRAQA